MKSRRTIVVGTAAVAAAAFLGAAAYYQKEEASVVPVESNTLVRPHSPIIGRKDAPVTIVEFLDPSCEACRAFYPVVKQIMAAFPDKTRLVIRYAPLHQGSDEAVRILEAARAQDKFDVVLEKLFAEQPHWAIHGAPDLDAAWRFAGDAGLDIEKARVDAKAPSVVAALNADIADIKEINLQGTPTFFVNGQPLVTFGPQELFDLVAQEVKAAESASRAPGS